MGTLKFNAKVKNILSALLYVGVLFGVYIFFSPPIFQTNDDIFLMSLVSGKEVGVPEERIFFISYPIGWLLSKLYSFVSGIQWYGIFLLGCHFGSLVYFFYLLLSVSKKKINQTVIVTFGMLIAIFVWMPQVINIQFTSTAGIMAVLGVFGVCRWNKKDKLIENTKILFTPFLLILIAFNIRIETVFLVCPILILTWLMKLRDDKKNKLNLKIYFITPIIVIALMGLNLILNQSFYNQNEWQKFSDFSRTRASVFDYYGLPDFEKAEKICSEKGIDNLSYELIKKYNFLLYDRNFDTDCMKRLKGLSSRQVNLHDVYNEYIDSNKNFTGILILLLYGLTILTALAKKRYLVVIDSILFKGAIIGIWFLILIRGRAPERIVVPLLLLELCIILSLFITELLQMTIRRKQMIGYIFVFFIMTLVGIYQNRLMKNSIDSRLYFSQGYEKIKEFCANNIENFYVCDVSVLHGGVTEKVFGEKQDLRNVVYTGGWMANSPWYSYKYNQYGLAGDYTDLYQDNVYAIFVQSNSLKKDLFNYLSLSEEINMSIEEVITGENGEQYEVVKFTH